MQFGNHFNIMDPDRDAFMLHGPLARNGYDWWWHSFTAREERTGEEKAFFIEFFAVNPALAEEEPVFGQMKENQGKRKKPSYLMVKAGCWGEDHCQLHRFFSWREVNMHETAPFSVEAGDCRCSEGHLTGEISVSSEDAARHPEWMSDAGEMSWKLEIRKEIAFNVGYGASEPFRKANAFQMYWHAEGMKTLYRGEVRFNGKKYLVDPENCYGYADKNWGSDFTSPWVWLSSNCLYSRKYGRELKNSAFDIGGGRPKIYFLPLDRRLLGAFCYEGQEFDFNFSKVWLDVKTKFSFRESGDMVYWHVTQQSRDALMDTSVRCRKKDMLFINYEAPNGRKRYSRLWNGGTGEGIVRLFRRKGRKMVLVDEVLATHVGCEYGEYDE